MATRAGSAAESLAALLKTASPELREVLTERTSGSYWWPPMRHDRTALPVPEATLAAMQWCMGRQWAFGWDDEWWVDTSYEKYGGTDIFVAIRAALGGE